MSLTGRLEAIELAELLHFLSLNNRTGKVTLSRRDAHGVVVVRLGRIVYAASSSIRETFGSILLSRGLASPEALADALERQHSSADERRRLGDLLVEAGAISRAQLEEALRQQTGVVVQELCRWRSGFFRFDVGPVASGGDIGVDAEDLVLATGVATDQVLLEAMTRMDEAAPAEAPTTPLTIASSPLAPALRGEVTLGLLRRAAAVVERGLLLVLRGDEAQGVGQVGLEELPDADDLARAVRLPLNEPSVVSEAVERRESWRGPVPPGPANDGLLDRLGGVRPPEALVIPMVLGSGVGLAFYGDNAVTRRPLGPTEDLEWALLEAGLGMERDLLEERMRAFEAARGHRP